MNVYCILCDSCFSPECKTQKKPAQYRSRVDLINPIGFDLCMPINEIFRVELINGQLVKVFGLEKNQIDLLCFSKTSFYRTILMLLSNVVQFHFCLITILWLNNTQSVHTGQNCVIFVFLIFQLKQFRRTNWTYVKSMRVLQYEYFRGNKIYVPTVIWNINLPIYFICGPWNALSKT